MDVYKVLNNVRTHLIVFGDPFCGNKEVIVVITGAPGIVEFYKEFGDVLYQNTGLPVCIIGHAGHDTIRNEIQRNNDQYKTLYKLKGQIDHKLHLMEKIINRNCKLHLIGHSIGAWMVLEMLDNNEDLVERLVSIQLLFPTLQNISDAEMAVYLKLPRMLHTMGVFSLKLFDLLPRSIRTFFIKKYLTNNSLPLDYVDRVMIYINPQVVKKVLELAYDILDKVDTLNINAINKVKHLTRVVYSPKDHWVPLDHIEELKKLMPQLQMQEFDVEHAFVLKSSVIVGESAANFIKECQ